MFEMAFTIVDWNSVTYNGDHIFRQLSYSHSFCAAILSMQHMYVQLEVGYTAADKIPIVKNEAAVARLLCWNESNCQLLERF